jgi:hypothetical protein
LGQLLPDILNNDQPQLLGNFCAIIYNPSTKTIKIKTDRYRSFPIYIHEQSEITNLSKSTKVVWADSLINVGAAYVHWEVKFDAVVPIDTSAITLDQALTEISQILDKSTQDFLSNNHLPVRVHLSGGIDSMLIYSFLEKFTSDYELVTCQHVDYDYFWLKNSGTIKNNFWGYNQIHHWHEPCVITSGTPGDEFMLRGPSTVDLYLKFYGHNVVNLLNLPEWHNSLMQTYLRKPKNYKIFKEQQLDQGWDQEMLFWNLCNTILNDWQHWHLGNTLTWTPLRNLEIFKIMLRLPVNDVIGQVMNADISRALIGRNNPKLLDYLSPQKNSGNVMENLTDFLLQKNNG